MTTTVQKPFFQQGGIFSHRGFHQVHPENTEKAFAAAVQLGYSGLETDLRTSKDGHLVLCHDVDLRRVGGPQVPVEQLNRTSLEKLRLHDGAKVMFFDHFVDQFPHQRLILDIKPETGQRTIFQLVDFIRSEAPNLVQRSAFLTWKPDHEELLLGLIPDCALFARESCCWRAGLACLLFAPFLSNIQKGRCYAVPPRFCGISLFTERMVKAFHDQGAYVAAYLPNSLTDIEKAQVSGFDCVLTEIPLTS